jgi:hypothetical protein
MIIFYSVNKHLIPIFDRCVIGEFIPEINMHHREMHPREMQNLQNPGFNANFQKKRDKKAMDRESDPNLAYGEDSQKLNVRYSLLQLLLNKPTACVVTTWYRSYVSSTKQGHVRRERIVRTHTT